MDFGERLRELRKHRGLSQRDLAGLVGIDFTYLSKIEVGRMDPPSEAVIRKLAQSLGADADELINLAGKVPKELKAVLGENPQAVELLRVLSERRLPEETYQEMLKLAQQWADAAEMPAAPTEPETPTSPPPPAKHEGTDETR